MFFQTKKWKDSIKKLQNNEITIQQFVDINEKMTLYHSTPFGKDKDGNDCVYAMKNNGFTDFSYMPVFLKISDCKCHFDSSNRAEYLIIKSNLHDALHSLDSNRIFNEWGLVINPNSQLSIGIPAHIRVRPKCLQD